LLAAEPAAARLISGRPSNRDPNRHDSALRARLQSSLTGRWSKSHAYDVGTGLDLSSEEDPLKPAQLTETHDAHGVDRARNLALLLLKRHGVLTREMTALEQIDISWHEILFALRRMEYAGTVRRGWFVRALSGEQYALPEALEMLRAV